MVRRTGSGRHCSGDVSWVIPFGIRLRGRSPGLRDPGQAPDWSGGSLAGFVTDGSLSGGLQPVCIEDRERLSSGDPDRLAGFAATMMDSITGCAVRSMLEAGVTYTTISLELKMLRPPPMEEDMVAVADVVNVSRRLGVATGVLKSSNGKVLAEGSTTCMIFRD